MEPHALNPPPDPAVHLPLNTLHPEGNILSSYEGLVLNSHSCPTLVSCCSSRNPEWDNGRDKKNSTPATLSGVYIPSNCWKIIMLGSQLINLRNLNGFIEPFLAVPFKNGEDPTKDPASVFVVLWWVFKHEIAQSPCHMKWRWHQGHSRSNSLLLPWWIWSYLPIPTSGGECGCYEEVEKESLDGNFDFALNKL